MKVYRNLIKYYCFKDISKSNSFFINLNKKDIIKSFSFFSSSKFSTNNLPNSSESTDILLNQMEDINNSQINQNTKNKNSNNGVLLKENSEKNYFIKENVMFLSNKNNHINLNEIKINDVIIINEKYIFIVLALQETITTLLFLNTTQNDFKEIKDKKIFNFSLFDEDINSIRIYIKNPNKSSIWQNTDFLIRFNIDLLPTNFTPKLSRKNIPIEYNTRNLITNNMLIDNIYPIQIGNFNLFKGIGNHGQEKIFVDIIKNFSGKILLLTMNQKLINNLNKDTTLNKEDIKIVLGSKTKNSNSDFSNTIIPYVALNVIDNFVKQPMKKDLLVIVDNYVDFFIDGLITYSNAELYQPYINFGNELFELSRVYNNCTVTTIIVSIL